MDHPLNFCACLKMSIIKRKKFKRNKKQTYTALYSHLAKMRTVVKIVFRGKISSINISHT